MLEIVAVSAFAKRIHCNLARQYFLTREIGSDPSRSVLTGFYHQRPIARYRGQEESGPDPLKIGSPAGVRTPTGWTKTICATITPPGC